MAIYATGSRTTSHNHRRNFFLAIVIAGGMLLGTGGRVAVGFPDAGCPMGKDHQQSGPLSFQDTHGNSFDYEADAGSADHGYNYQVAIKNTGSSPLTVSWRKPSYFRRGIAPDTIALGQCLPDGNTPNKDSDTIMYGPNVQLTGPVAWYYRPASSSQTAARQPPPPSLQQTGVFITFDAREGGTTIALRLTLESALASSRPPGGPQKIVYSFSNAGDSVWVKWTAILGPRFLDIARASPLVLDPVRGILLKDRGETRRVEVTGTGARRIVQTVDVTTLDGALLYRDLAPAWTFDEIKPYSWQGTR